MKTFKPTAKMSHGGHYCWGGKVMKKAKGGPTAREMVEYYKSKDRSDTSWIEEDGKANPRATANLHFENYKDKMKEEFPKNYEDEPSVRTRAYSEKAKDFGEEGQVGKKRGGIAKPFWETKSPKKESKKLTPMQKASAKARAAKAGRPYPNLIDNAAAARRAK